MIQEKKSADENIEDTFTNSWKQEEEISLDACHHKGRSDDDKSKDP